VHEKNLWPQGHTSVINIAVYSADGKKILSISLDCTIKEWDASSGHCLKTYDVFENIHLFEYITAANIKLKTERNIIYAPPAP